MCQLPTHQGSQLLELLLSSKTTGRFYRPGWISKYYRIIFYVPTADSRLLQEVKTTFSKSGAQQRVRIYLCQSKNIQVYGEQTLNADYHAEKVSTQLLANITREKLLGTY
uniref:Uncharacterized protein n=1 Tax=Fusarium oxysporum (strain Fo5176) TaxID=660025 RepID=A0A0D2XHM8_FUSOF